MRSATSDTVEKESTPTSLSNAQVQNDLDRNIEHSAAKEKANLRVSITNMLPDVQKDIERLSRRKEEQVNSLHTIEARLAASPLAIAAIETKHAEERAKILKEVEQRQREAVEQQIKEEEALKQLKQKEEGSLREIERELAKAAEGEKHLKGVLNFF